MPRIHSYLLTHRKKWALTQDELGLLLGGYSRSSISRFERDLQEIPREVVIACQVIFDGSPREMFPKVFGEIEATVLRNAVALDEQLRGKEDWRSRKKRELLFEMTQRADAPPWNV